MELSANCDPFSTATSVTFRVFNFELVKTDPGTVGSRAKITADLATKGQDGKAEFFLEATPHTVGRRTMWAIEDGGFHLFDYAFTNDCLVLEMQKGDFHFKARLKKRTSIPGQPKKLPSWVGTWRTLDRGFVGLWEQSEFSTDFHDFSDATNIAFRVYAVNPSRTFSVTTNSHADMVAELVVKTSDGTQSLAPDSIPVRLYAHGIAFGAPGDALFFRHSLTNGFLVLSDETRPHHFRAKLKRTDIDAGNPKLLPMWMW